MPLKQRNQTKLNFSKGIYLKKIKLHFFVVVVLVFFGFLEMLFWKLVFKAS